MREATTKGASRYRKGVHTCRLWRRPWRWMNRWWVDGGVPPFPSKNLQFFKHSLCCPNFPQPKQAMLPLVVPGSRTKWHFPELDIWQCSSAFQLRQIGTWLWSVLLDEEVLEQMEEGDAWGSPPYNNSIDVRTSAFGEVELRWMRDVLEKWCWEMLGGKKSYDGPTIQSGEWRQAVCGFPQVDSLFMLNECVGLIGLWFCAYST